MGTSRNKKKALRQNKLAASTGNSNVKETGPEVNAKVTDVTSGATDNPKSNTKVLTNNDLDIVLYDPRDLPSIKIDPTNFPEDNIVNAGDVFSRDNDEDFLSFSEKIGLTALLTVVILLVVSFLTGFMQGVIQGQLEKHPTLKSSDLLVKLSQCGSLMHRKKSTFVRVTANGVLDENYVYDCTGEIYKYLSRSKRLLHGCINVIVTDYDATGIFTINTDLYGKLYLYQYDRVEKAFVFLSSDERVEYHLRLADVGYIGV